RGTHEPGPRYVRLLSLLYGRRPTDLDVSDPGLDESGQRSAATIELIQHAQASDLDPSAAETIDAAVDRLCRSYSTTPPILLMPRVQQRLWHFHNLLSSRLTMAQHQHLLQASGWLYLLLAALHNDLGEREPADSS